MRVLFQFLCLIALVLGTSQPQLANEQGNLEASLKSQLEGKIVFLRGFPRGEHLRYDSKGGLLGKEEKGVWTLDGRMEINRIRIGKHECTLEGNRLATSFDYKKRTSVYSRIYSTEIEIQLADSNPDDALKEALGRVLLRPGEKLEEQAASYWRHFLENPFAEDSPTGRDPSGASIRQLDQPKPGWKNSAPMGVRVQRPAAGEAHEPDYYLEDGTPVFRATGQDTPMFYARSAKISAPKVTYSPDPEYPEAMRKHRVRGTSVFWAIIGTDGKVKELQVIRPLGMGFDEAGAEAILKWKFDPAKLEGKPVPVRINIEINFRI